MLLFIDESGHDRCEMPCEVLAGVAIAEENLWNLVRAIRHAEQEHFGGYLRNLYSEEPKANKLLKAKRFKEAERDVEIGPEKCLLLANSLLQKGKSSKGKPTSNPTFLEIVAFSRKVLEFVDAVLDLAANFNVQVFASVVPIIAPRCEKNLLRKDYVYLFERYFYFLETLPRKEMGLIVFDELDKAQSHILMHQMAAYFLGTQTGRFRSSRIVPEPFFVHSDLTTGVFLADLAAYILGWGWRRSFMPERSRAELEPLARKLHAMQFKGEKPDEYCDQPRQLYGINYIDDLRGSSDKQ
ncbi:MAG: DUF3800 domain-containing protein [Planctomycetes bacterium]|nr:DUF3800 domain-containing protein [Planctomycetota bacterium]MBU4399792.1 DUF3800 domain-containing protein [Planctomycetota bacterium]MCG2682189.1 DUF3800 domain-containing protein [Planctomycetales bacterium]